MLAAAALLAVLVRTAMTFWEVSQLAETRRQARTDELTGLANRRALYQHLDTWLASTSVGEFAVLLLDLDRFKEVNDALGHGVGDELLCQLGARLSAQLREGDLVARLGGDEFAVLLGPPSGESAATAAAERILGTLQGAFTLRDVSLHVDVSTGIALYPQHGNTRSELLRCADVAMYHAKRARCGVATYAVGADVNNRARLLTIEQLREAIAAKQLTCYYQPKVNVPSGAVVGAEALVRWEHPERGVLSPADFLPLAEQTRLMADIFSEVLDQALAQCQAWRRAGHDLGVAVNLSVTNLLDLTLCRNVATLLDKHRLTPGVLVLEITEDILMADPNGARTVLGSSAPWACGCHSTTTGPATTASRTCGHSPSTN